MKLIVVGAGIVGAALAACAAREGLRVTIVSDRPPGDGATAAGMGHLVVLDDDPAELALSAWSLRLWYESAHLQASEYRNCGTLWLASEPHELAPLQAKAARLRAVGVGSEWLDNRALRKAEPLLREGLAGALRVPGDAVVYAPRYAQALVSEACELHGAHWLREVPVRALVPGGVMLAGGRTLHADAVVVAAGAQSRYLLPELPFVARKGHLAITDRVPLVLNHQVVEVGYGASAHGCTDSVAFNLQPRATGQLLIGSCRQVGREDAALEPEMLAQMLRRALAFVPALAEVPVVRAWTGVRPGTPDGRPYLGAWPLQPGVWVATGHEGLGVTTALGSARLLVDQLLGRTPAIDPAPFDPGRVLVQAEAALP
jgi:glycine/D-amino acid oxidase-like deaminating enzyme